MKFSEANRYPLELRNHVSGAPTHEVLTEKDHHRYFFYIRGIYQKLSIYSK
ncbi:MAG: hypothetical protein HWN81_07075 [Candidatus Lokiarchaeota archaeon]|nr:hypothetical protein [Candidatus Lokiarchaeota archaeon]